MKKRIYNFPIGANTDKIVAIDGIGLAEPRPIMQLQSFVELFGSDNDGYFLRMVFNEVGEPPLVPAITLLGEGDEEYTALGVQDVFSVSLELTSVS